MLGSLWLSVLFVIPCLAQRLHDGNSLVCDGPGSIFYEVAPDGTIVWEHWADRSPPIFRAERVFLNIPDEQDE